MNSQMRTSKEPEIPGIYLDNVAPTPEPELLTGVPVFFGLATAKSVKKYEPKKLTSENQFDQYFRSFPQNKEYLGEAVKGFFKNGGRLCYVILLNNLELNTLQEALEASEVLENTDLVCVPDIILLENVADTIKHLENNIPDIIKHLVVHQGNFDW